MLSPGFSRLFSWNRSVNARGGSVEEYYWEFPAGDLNESARALFRRIDSLVETLRNPDYTFLVSIELDMEAGRFPSAMAQYFNDVAGSEDRTFFVKAVRHTPGEGAPVGRLTIEIEPGDLALVLRQDDGFRWGANVRVWGLQVQRVDVPGLIELDPFDDTVRAELAGRCRSAWVAADDLDGLALWVSHLVLAPERARLNRLGS